VAEDERDRALALLTLQHTNTQHALDEVDLTPPERQSAAFVSTSSSRFADCLRVVQEQ